MILVKFLINFLFLFFLFLYKEQFPSSFFINVVFFIYLFLIIYFLILSKASKQIRNFIKLSSFLSFIFFLLSLGSIIFDIHSFKSSEVKNEYVIVLGAGLRRDQPKKVLKYRLDKAVEYQKKYPNTIFIVSGGQGKDEIISESKAMKKYLIKNSIPAQNIIEENKSKTTLENLKFSKELIPKNIKSIGIISNDFHIYRVKFLAKTLNLELNPIYATTPKRSKVSLFIREALAVIYYKLKMTLSL
ncbi:MAG: YdcF family protein [Cetobacterium sp.]